ncbi:plasmid transfer operon protein [Novosphingobium sp. B1]|nr:plasmid transfer operon protein [Novosphingobium sp. B1]
MALSFGALRERLLAGLLGDAEQVEAGRPMLMLDMLSDWLPYRVYDPTSRLYVNARSKGFVLGVTPLIGADERTGEILGAFFSEGLPAGSCLQILHLASPRISRIVGPWFAPRYEQGGVYEAIARHRAKKLYSMVWTSGANDAPFHARAHQVVISLGVPAAKAVSNEELTHAREGLIAMLKSLNLGVIEYEPHDLIALLDDLTSPTTAPQDDAVPYNPNDPIANQAIRRDIELLVREDRIELGTERFRATGVHKQGVPEIGAVYPDRFDVRHFAVRNMPPRWAPHECARLIGDLFTDKLRFSERYGLFYFFAQSCGACEVMSPIVQSVAQTWHITVRAVSTDGGPSRHFPRYTVETNQRARMGLDPGITPAVVLWDAATARAIPIGYGVMSADELQDRIYLLTSKEAGRDY